MEICEKLNDWIVNFFKNKDLMTQKIQKISNDVITYKDKVVKLISLNNLGDYKGAVENREDHYVIVVLNNRSNLDVLLSDWKTLVEYKNLTIYFINPYSKPENKWILRPYIHNKITEPSSLKQGLLTMFGTVLSISEEEFKSKI